MTGAAEPGRLAVALAMSATVAGKLFSPGRLERMRAEAPELRLLADAPLTRFDDARAERILAETEVLITGWGCAMIDAPVLDRAPRLRLISHAGGSVKGHVSPEAWERGVAVCSAAGVNAQPVAEYTLAMILLAGKRAIPLSRVMARSAGPFFSDDLFPDMGNYRKRVGIVGASMIGRRTVELLRPFDLEVVVYDPYLSDAEAAGLGVEAVTLDELLRTSDIVSLHAPSLPGTYRLIDRARIDLMRVGATLINTARGALLDHDALARRVERGELSAVLDVTDPEHLPADHPLRRAENVLLTPHLAGSMGTELARVADRAVAEARRHARGRALMSPVRSEELFRLA